MNPINATLAVDVSADWIWALITHFAKYPDWNRLTPTVEGDARLNARLRLVLAPATQRPIALKARVLVAARNRELRWSGASRFPGMLKVEHGFRIEQRAGGCRLYHSLACAGWRANERLIAALQESFEATNAALRERAGSTVSPTVVPFPAPAAVVPGQPALTLNAG